MMILQDRASVERRSNNTSSATGAKSSALEVVIESLPCYIEPDDGVVIVPQSGQTSVYYMNMFCDIADIRPNDIVTDLSTGEKFKVINTNEYRILKHMEVRMQGGTVK